MWGLCWCLWVLVSVKKVWGAELMNFLFAGTNSWKMSDQFWINFLPITSIRGGPKQSRADPCSVDFGREAPKFWSGFAVDSWVDFFFLMLSSKKKAPENPLKIPCKIRPGSAFGKIPLGFLQNAEAPLLTNKRLRFSALRGKAQAVLFGRASCYPGPLSFWLGHLALILNISGRASRGPRRGGGKT